MSVTRNRLSVLVCVIVTVLLVHALQGCGGSGSGSASTSTTTTSSGNAGASSQTATTATPSSTPNVFNDILSLGTSASQTSLSTTKSVSKSVSKDSRSLPVTFPGPGGGSAQLTGNFVLPGTSTLTLTLTHFTFLDGLIVDGSMSITTNLTGTLTAANGTIDLSTPNPLTFSGALSGTHKIGINLTVVNSVPTNCVVTFDGASQTFGSPPIRHLVTLKASSGTLTAGGSLSLSGVPATSNRVTFSPCAAPDQVSTATVVSAANSDPAQQSELTVVFTDKSHHTATFQLQGATYNSGQLSLTGTVFPIPPASFPTTFGPGALVIDDLPPAGGVPSITRLLQTKMQALRPIKGVSYQPSPSNYTGTGTGIYFDTDFYNSDFPALWGPTGNTQGVVGNNDLQTLSSAGFNFLHIYNWNAQRNHAPFLTAVASHNMKVMIPISNYTHCVFCGCCDGASGGASGANANVVSIVDQIVSGGTVNPAAGMWGVYNEFDLNGISATEVATIAADIVQEEENQGLTNPADTIGICVPTSFAADNGQAPGISQTMALLAAYQANSFLSARNVLQERVFFAINPFTPASFNTTYINTTFPAVFTNNSPTNPLFFSESGTNIGGNGTSGAQGQATYELAQLQATNPIATNASSINGYFLGTCIFEYSYEPFADMNPSPAACPQGGAPAISQGGNAQWGLQIFNCPLSTITDTTSSSAPNGTANMPYPVDTRTPQPAWTSVQQGFAPPTPCPSPSP